VDKLWKKWQEFGRRIACEVVGHDWECRSHRSKVYTFVCTRCGCNRDTKVVEYCEFSTEKESCGKLRKSEK